MFHVGRAVLKLTVTVKSISTEEIGKELLETDLTNNVSIHCKDHSSAVDTVSVCNCEGGLVENNWVINLFVNRITGCISLSRGCNKIIKDKVLSRRRREEAIVFGRKAYFKLMVEITVTGLVTVINVNKDFCFLTA